MIRTRVLAAALTAGALGALVAVLPAHGQDAVGPRTLVFTTVEKHGDERFVDARPKGMSVGDRWLLATALRQAGRSAGRLEADCVGVDKRFGVLQCSLVAILPDGRLTLQGTGAYVGAVGTMRREGDGDRDTLTFTLGT